MFPQHIFNAQIRHLFFRKVIKTLGTIFMCFFGAISLAGEADIMGISVQKTDDYLYDFNVTVFHKDSGWKHYVNKWDILDSNGKVLATRTLYHPHVNEQPFTRTLSNVEIPKLIKSVTVRAYDTVHEYGGKEMVVTLPLK